MIYFDSCRTGGDNQQGPIEIIGQVVHVNLIIFIEWIFEIIYA
ncbi:hypothetical protein [Serpentinicella alkaliphila]|nr:hypothetical protein [Serpentinicella alkaliphila]